MADAASQHLSHSEFFERLAELFASHRTQEHDSIYLTQKRLPPSHQPAADEASVEAINTIDGRAREGVSQSVPFAIATSSNPSLADLFPARPQALLIRATNGKSQQPDQSKGTSRGQTQKQENSAAAAAAAARNQKKGKVKLSTVVMPEDLDAFFVKYADCAKLGMSAGLKKRDRRLAKKKKGDKKKQKSANA